MLGKIIGIFPFKRKSRPIKGSAFGCYEFEVITGEGAAISRGFARTTPVLHHLLGV
jgi:hypothetical protein